MPQICFAFSGLASAAPQMGRSLYDKVLTVRNAMDRADKIFAPEGYKVTKACFLASAEELAKPSVAAPALFAIQCGIYDALKSRHILPQFICASGLAELSAAVCLGGWPFEGTIRALRSMAQAMETGQYAALPAMPYPSTGPWSLYSLKSGYFAASWRELFAAPAWFGEPETGLSQSLAEMRAKGMDTFVEIGPGELMGPKARAVDSGIRILATHDAKSLSIALKLAL